MTTSILGNIVCRSIIKCESHLEAVSQVWCAHEYYKTHNAVFEEQVNSVLLTNTARDR